MCQEGNYSGRMDFPGASTALKGVHGKLDAQITTTIKDFLYAEPVIPIGHSTSDEIYLIGLRRR